MNPIISSLSSELGLPPWFLILVIAWVLAWKGVALWKAARLNHKFFFIILLVVQSLGLFEILYIFLFSKIDLNSTHAQKQTQKTRNGNKVQKTRKGKASK